MVPKIPRSEKGAKGAKLFSMQRGNSTKVDIHAMTFVRLANMAGNPGVAPNSDENESPMMMLYAVQAQKVLNVQAAGTIHAVFSPTDSFQASLWVWGCRDGGKAQLSNYAFLKP
jgi:hypothetical protein